MSRTLTKAKNQDPAHSSRGAHAFANVEAELRGTPAAERQQPNVDLQVAGTVATQVLPLFATPAVKAQLAALVTAKLFDAHAVERLTNLAWAAIHIRTHLNVALAASSEASVPEQTITEASGVRKRMLGVVTYQLGEDPAHSAHVQAIVSGQGHLDTASDLDMLADLYHSEHARLSKDTKFQKDDELSARRLAAAIYDALGSKAGKDVEGWNALQGAIWPKLLAAYDELRRVGTFLFWDQSPETLVPSLITASRSTSGKSAAPVVTPVAAPTTGAPTA